MPAAPPDRAEKRVIADGIVVQNASLCDEHYRITFLAPSFPTAYPGQFVHLGPMLGNGEPGPTAARRGSGGEPFLRKAFSIAALRRGADGVQVDVIYRVVGTLTNWLERLRLGDAVSMLGPQGNRFPVVRDRSHVWLVAGGVGLPPLSWLAEELGASGDQQLTFFYGAMKSSLLALELDRCTPPAADATKATLCAPGLAGLHVPAVISTDDGSVGFRGHVGKALDAYARGNPVPGDQLVLYTCGPERMMAFVAEFAVRIGALCYACVERSMACATGMCQSCVVPVHEPADAAGWRYRLCCTDGPVFDSREVIWDFEARQARTCPTAG